MIDAMKVVDFKITVSMSFPIISYLRIEEDIAGRKCFNEKAKF